MSEKALTSQLEVFPSEVTAISFNRNYSALSRLAERRERLARALKTAEISNIRKACRASVQKQSKKSSSLRRSRYQSRNLLNLFAWLRLEKVDTTLVYREELRKTSETMDVYRAAPEEFPSLQSAFITFANPLAAHMVCQTVIYTSLGYITPRTMPLSVDDVVWSNVNIT
jgi:hypothetical protein